MPTPDGRTLEVLDTGQEGGFPLVFHFGTQSAAVPVPFLAEPARERGLRLVTYSRPGYGGSSPRPDGAQSHPLEVVAEGSQDACMLNVDALAPGDHDVLVVAVDAPSRVRIEDPSGAEVFRAERKPADRAGPSPSPTVSPVAGAVSLEVGTYRVVCDIEDGATATVPLRVRPADELD